MFRQGRNQCVYMIAIMFNLYLPKCSQREFQLQITGSHTIKKSFVLLDAANEIVYHLPKLDHVHGCSLTKWSHLKRQVERSHQDDFILATFH